MKTYISTPPDNVKVYAALLTQSGPLSAPTVTIQQNTLGGSPTFATPDDSGIYKLQGTGLFPSGTMVSWTNGVVASPTTAGVIFSWERSSDDELTIRTYDKTGNLAEWEVTNGTLEILVYP